MSLLPQAPLPTREPNSPGALITRIELAAVQTALQRAAVKAEFMRTSGNTSLGLIDDTWDDPRATRDAWYADALETRRRQAAEARAFAERPRRWCRARSLPAAGLHHLPRLDGTGPAS